MRFLLTGPLWSSLLQGFLLVMPGRVDPLSAAHIPETVTSNLGPPAEVSTFVQSLGVNTHLGYSDTPYYGQPQRVVAALQYLGINTVRDQSPTSTNQPITSATDNALASAGIKFDVLIPGKWLCKSY